MRKLDRQHQIHYRMNEEKFEQRIRDTLIRYSEENETISLEELERWVEADRERRKLKNRISRLVLAMARKTRLRK